MTDDIEWKRVKCPECGSIRMALYDLDMGDAKPFRVRCARCGRSLIEQGT